MKCPKCESENIDTARFCSSCAAPIPGAEGAALTKTLETPAADLARGSTFAGRYEIIEELGEGGMGRVYRVEDTKVKEVLALKLIRPEIAADKKTIERFSSELKTARKIVHKNVGRVYELMEEKGIHFITMEYVSGQDLKGLIRQSGQLSTGTALSIAKQICEGLSEAHKSGIIHRDLKPGNIMIDKDGNARIMDFGIARSLKTEGKTGSGVMIGTPAYMPPEQADGKEVDQRSDIYSLGIILYEMLTGRVPFEGDTPFTIGMKHKAEMPKNPREFNNQIPDDLSYLILKCMEKEKERRFQSAEALRSELIKIEEDRPSTHAEVPESKPPASKESKMTFRKSWLMIIISLIAVIIIGSTILYLTKEKPSTAPEKKKLVVLPFENLGAPEDEYFADGVTDAITARLARLQNLGVISRQSAVQYKNSTKNPSEISEELGGVQYILEGTIQRERPSDPTSRVRIIPQLIDVSNNTHLWADTYDDEFVEVFRVQSEIAERVAKALEVVLLEPEHRTLTDQPTDNPEAYELYLRAGKYSRLIPNENKIAIELLERTVAADPNFVLAYVRLSRLYSGAFFTFDRSEQNKFKAKEHADLALLLDPKLPDAHLALGYYYYECLRDYEEALKEFAIAKQGMPNEAALLMAEAFIWRRQAKMEKAAENFKKALTLNPRSPSAAIQLGITHSGMSSYAEAEMYLDKAIYLAPDSPDAYIWQARNYLAWQGDLRQARAVMESIPEGIDARGYDVYTWMRINRIEHNYEEALARLLAMPIEVLSFQAFFFPKALLIADVRRALGDTLQAHEDYESARKILEHEIAERPDDPRLHSALGLVFAGLGSKQDAVREGLLAVEQAPISKDYYLGSYFSENLAQVFMRVGEDEKAIDQLESLISAQSGMLISPALLRVDPRWDSLRGNPRFEKLLKESSK